MKTSHLSKEAILATQRIRTLLSGPDDPKLAIRMAEIIDEQFAKRLVRPTPVPPKQEGE